MEDESGTAPQKPAKPRPRKNTKRTGEFSEASFLVKATSLGFKVAKPWGDSERYDFIVACPDHSPEFFWRVQVKCTEITRARAYEVRAAYTAGKVRATYTSHDIDFLVAHVVPRNIWYVLPVAACMPSPMLRFYPDGAGRRGSSSIARPGTCCVPRARRKRSREITLPDDVNNA